ncbi:hypothetical protein JCM8547_004839 [Rhodosporidiobolus lusitaniae]
MAESTEPTQAPQVAPNDVARLYKRSASALHSLDSSLKETTGGAAVKKRKTSIRTSSTPALEAILARTARSTPMPSSAPPAANYDPTSLPALLARLSTYRLSSFSPSKPSSLSSLACALHGWKHTSSTRERVQCVTCSRGVVLLPPSASEGGWTSPAGQKLREEYEKALFSKEAGESLHKETCPWRMRPCARSLYRLPGGGLGVKSGRRRELLEELGRVAGEMEERGLGEIELVLPKEGEKLMADEAGRERLIKAMRSVATFSSSTNEAPPAEHTSLFSTTLLLAIFGWSLSTPSSSSSSARPALSRSASNSSLSSIHSFSSASSSATPILSCSFCNRQILASSYLSSSTLTSSASAPKQFDSVKQHQSFCPFISSPSSFSTTATPPMKTPAAGPLKPGWQVRLEAVMQRSVAAGSSATQSSTEGEQQDGGRAASLVGAGKTNELLSYVRGLLGPKIKLPARSRFSFPTTAAGAAGGTTGSPAA